MLLFWHIRYYDTCDRQFKDRDLWVDTEALDPVSRSALEATNELANIGHGREMLRYRQLFLEKTFTEAELNELGARHRASASFCIPDYFEDENGKELTPQAMGQALTGDPNTVLIPAGAKKHDVEFMFAPKPDIDLSLLTIPPDDIETLGYFSRDLRELEASPIVEEGPGSLILRGNSDPILNTSTTEDEIRSFITILRRLYMTKEPGNFIKAADAFARAVEPHSVGRWVQGVKGEYEKCLATVPVYMPIILEMGVRRRDKIT